MVWKKSKNGHGLRENKFELRVIEKEGGVVFCVTNINIYYFLENVNRNISLSQINTMSNQYNNTLLPPQQSLIALLLHF